MLTEVHTTTPAIRVRLAAALLSIKGINLLMMPRLHLPYDEYTMPIRCPNHRFRATSAGRPCDHRTDLRASWPLRFCLTPHKDKFEKIISP